ncbi:MAG: hypothetical protein HOQ24_01675 [Mycobacteriaceae bacterium]|nr:hypothetical protein [Mycobacteriaceae bacterium]
MSYQQRPGPIRGWWEQPEHGSQPAAPTPRVPPAYQAPAVMPAGGQHPQTPGHPAYHAAMRPSGGAAITAGLLAIAGGLLGLTTMIFLLVLVGASPDDFADARPVLVTSAALSGVLGLMLLLGAAMLLAGLAVGRALVATAAGVVLVGHLAGAVYLLVQMNSHGAPEDFLAPAIVTLSFALFPLTTFVLAVLGSTTRWLAYRRSR